jgi:hypothetical protein
MYVVDKNMRGAVSRKSQKLFIGSMQALSAATVLMSFLNAADIIFHRVPGPYFVGIILHLGLVGHMFARLLLRPLWHSLHLREQEHELSGATASKQRMHSPSLIPAKSLLLGWRHNEKQGV